jgi:hypothetical protein
MVGNWLRWTGCRNGPDSPPFIAPSLGFEDLPSQDQSTFLYSLACQRSSQIVSLGLHFPSYRMSDVDQRDTTWDTVYKVILWSPRGCGCYLWVASYHRHVHIEARGAATGRDLSNAFIPSTRTLLLESEYKASFCRWGNWGSELPISDSVDGESPSTTPDSCFVTECHSVYSYKWNKHDAYLHLYYL